jgi:hypothetical protein
MLLKNLLLALLVLTATMIVVSKSLASDFGTTGLVTIPTARMQPDGSLTATIAQNNVLDIFNVTYQATSFIEATFRYTIAVNPDGLDSADEYQDRSYGIKVKLLDEGHTRPAVAVGIRDIFGTGILAAEYFVVSKKLLSVDVSVGLGWGRFAGRSSFSNPIRVLSNEFVERQSGDLAQTGGAVRSSTFFKGPVGIFGGVGYRIPNTAFRLSAEYASDDYKREVAIGVLRDPKPYSFGVAWVGRNGLFLGASYQQGRFLALTIKGSVNFKDRGLRRYERFYSVADQAGQEQAPEFLSLESWYDRLLFDAERSGLRIHSAHYRPGADQVSFSLSNDRYALWADALNQFYRLTEIHLPRAFNQVNVSTLEDNLRGPSVTYFSQRSKPIRSLKEGANSSSLRGQLKAIRVLPNSVPIRPVNKTDFGFPKLALGADLALRLQLMDPNEPLKHQLYVKGTGRLAVSEDFNLWSSVTLNVSNDFNTKRASDSVLPRVRSEVNRYLTEGENGIDSLFGEYRKSLLPNFHVRAYGGLLEEMFGGVGLEMLYEPFASRWSVGANLNWVKQRDFKKQLQFSDYEVLTGHLSVFYASRWHNFDFGLHVGRYLAGDLGVTFEARRTFDNGFSIGAFFTRTDVSAQDFGEGSYDKGLSLSMPYSLLIPRNTRGKYTTTIRTIERDGGRRLDSNVGQLWWNRRSVRFDSLQNNRDRISP